MFYFPFPISSPGWMFLLPFLSDGLTSHRLSPEGRHLPIISYQTTSHLPTYYQTTLLCPVCRAFEEADCEGSREAVAGTENPSPGFSQKSSRGGIQKKPITEFRDSVLLSKESYFRVSEISCFYQNPVTASLKPIAAGFRTRVGFLISRR